MRSPRVLIATWILALGLTSAAWGEDAPLRIAGAKTLSADAVIALINETPDLVIVDSRKPEDFATGAIEGAVLLTDTEMTRAALARIVPASDTPVLFYCNGVKCGRAANAVRKAIAWDYTNVYYYALGIVEWDRLGLPLVVTAQTSR